VARSWIPNDAKTTGTGEDLITDGRIAVLQLNECLIGQNTIEEAGNSLRVHGNPCRTGLTENRNDPYLKNNILATTSVVHGRYSGIRTGISEIQKKDTPTPRESWILKETNTPSTEDRAEDRYAANRLYREQRRQTTDQAERWKPPSVEIGFSSILARLAGRNGGGIGFILDSIDPPGGR